MRTNDLIPGKHYLSVDVLRAGRGPGIDCTAGGVTSPSRGFRAYVVLLGRTEVPTDADPDVCYLRLVVRVRFRDAIAIPIVDGEDRPGGMFGGNFVWTSDSRWSDAIEADPGYPIKVHDRFER